jgi:hypothetical protein
MYGWRQLKAAAYLEKAKSANVVLKSDNAREMFSPSERRKRLKLDKI